MVGIPPISGSGIYGATPAPQDPKAEFIKHIDLIANLSALMSRTGSKEEKEEIYHQIEIEKDAASNLLGDLKKKYGWNLTTLNTANNFLFNVGFFYPHAILNGDQEKLSSLSTEMDKFKEFLGKFH